MHKIIKKPTALFALLCCIFTMLIPLSADAYSLSEEEINQYLAGKSGASDKFGLPGLLTIDYTLRNAAVKIGRSEEKRVEINGLFDGVFRSAQQSFSGQINLSADTVPYYDAVKGQIYLKDVRILRWSVSPPQYGRQLQAVMPFLANNIASLLNDTPVYTLNENNPKEALIKKFAKGVRVEEGRLELDAGIF